MIYKTGCELRLGIYGDSYEPTTSIGGKTRWVKKQNTKQSKDDFSFEDFVRDEKGNLVLKK